MTAQRWWVQLAARWLARVDGVSGQLRLAMLALTGVSTATLTLQQYGLGRYAWPMIGIIAVGTLGYTYLYTEGGVWNQMARDRQDMSSNYAGPNARISSELGARGFVAGLYGRELTDDERRAVESELGDAFKEYRDGVDLQQLSD